jgi:UDP-glucuronate 4-epimerase
MKILVTGAAGFVGSRLSKRLLARGDTVVGLDNFISAYYEAVRKERNISDLTPYEHFSLVRGDFRDTEAIQSLLAAEKFDTVAHIGGMANVRYSVQNPLLYEEVNVRGTMNLLEAGRKSNNPYFVFASTSSVYGSDSEIPFREDATAMKPLAPYPASKRAAELMLHAYHTMSGLQATIVRFFSVYGPHGRPDMMPWHWTECILNHKPIALFGADTGDLRRDWTYIDDIVTGLVAAIDTRLPYETVNFGNGRPVENMRFIRTLEALLDEEAMIDHKPTPNSEPLETFADITKARDLLGYNPQTSVEEGLATFVAWYKAEGLAPEP